MLDTVQFILLSSLLGVIVFEYFVATDINTKASEALENAKQEGTSTCDKITIASELNWYASTKHMVQWRRGLMVSLACTFLLNVFSKLRSWDKRVRKTLISLLVIWTITVSVQGFSDYHMREVATNSISQVLSITKLTLNQCTSQPYKKIDLHGNGKRYLLCGQ
jgi:hypothetical protein